MRSRNRTSTLFLVSYAQLHEDLAQSRLKGSQDTLTAAHDVGSAAERTSLLQDPIERRTIVTVLSKLPATLLESARI